MAEKLPDLPSQLAPFLRQLVNDAHPVVCRFHPLFIFTAMQGGWIRAHSGQLPNRHRNVMRTEKEGRNSLGHLLFFQAIGSRDFPHHPPVHEWMFLFIVKLGAYVKARVDHGDGADLTWHGAKQLQSNERAHSFGNDIDALVHNFAFQHRVNELARQPDRFRTPPMPAVLMGRKDRMPAFQALFQPLAPPRMRVPKTRLFVHKMVAVAH